MNPRLAAGAIVGGAFAAAGLFALNRKKQADTIKKQEEKKVAEEKIAKQKIIIQDPSPNMRMIYCKEITDPVAKAFNMDSNAVQYSEIFETSVMQYIRRLDSSAVEFITDKTDIKGRASYVGNENSVMFMYQSFTKDQMIAMANVLEQHFAGINTVVLPNEADKQEFWLRCDKEIFFQAVLPGIAYKITPDKIANPKKPTIQEECYTSGMVYEPLCCYMESPTSPPTFNR